jgi:hypothetical protein
VVQYSRAWRNSALGDWFLEADSEGLKTLALCWVYRKRAFSVNGSFRKALTDLTRISVTQTLSEQMTLESKLLRDSQPSFLKPFFEKWAKQSNIGKISTKTAWRNPEKPFQLRTV